MKKVIAFIAAAVMLLSSITANAETTVNGTKIDCPFPESAYPVGLTTAGAHYKMMNGTSYTSRINSNIKYEVSAGQDAYAQLVNANSASDDGQKSIRIYGKGFMAADNYGTARISFHIGDKTADNTYVISFDAARKDTNWLDYVALNLGNWDGAARIEDIDTQWEMAPIGKGWDAGYGVTDWYHYEATLTTELDPQIDFAVFSYAIMYIDNIVVKDTEGNIIFSENFELYESVEEFLPDYECIEYGLYKGNELQETISGETTYTVKATLHNYKLDDGLDAQIMAFLRKDGVRVDAVASAAETIFKASYGSPDTDIKTEITVGDLSDGDYELVVYLWDGLGSMEILAPCKLYKEAE